MARLSGKRIVLIVASEGFQQDEYTIPKEYLRQEGAIIITASDKPGGAIAKDQKTTARVDITLDKLNPQDYNGIFFIGGPGAMEHLDNATSYKIISEAKKHNIPFGAICIAPRILAKGYGLEGKKATGWDDDGALEGILTGYGATYVKHPIVTDDLVVTATGPEAAKEFGEGILRVVTKKKLS